MLAATSRYKALSTTPNTYVAADGRTTQYLPRRLLPASGPVSMSAQVRVGAMERLDQIAARALGDPEQFWRLCDANDAMNPFNLLDEAHRRLRLPSPYASAEWTSTLAVARDAVQPLLGLPIMGGGVAERSR
jgi:hypothetical protein